MIIKAMISDLNYRELISVFSMPCGKIVGLLGLSTANRAAITLINTFEKLIISKLEKLLVKHKIFLSIDSVSASDGGAGNVILELQISDIDVMSAIEVIYPILDRSMAKNPKLARLGMFIARKEELAFDCLGKLIGELSDSEREELLIETVNAFDTNLIELLEKLSEDNSIHLKINRLFAK